MNDDYIPFEGSGLKRGPQTPEQIREDIERAQRSLAKIRAKQAKRTAEEREAERQKILGEQWAKGDQEKDCYCDIMIGHHCDGPCVMEQDRTEETTDDPKNER